MTTPTPAAAAPSLQQITSRALGVDMPEVALPSGGKVQTGTVAALLRNVQAYDGLARRLQRPAAGQRGPAAARAPAKAAGDTPAHAVDPDAAELSELRAALEAAVPTLLRVGLFDLFGPDEWLAGASPGRALVGAEARRILDDQAAAAAAQRGASKGP